MTVCEICGGDQFTLEDGFYFCNECHTQSQDIREMVTDDLFAQGAKEVRGAVASEKTLADRRRSKEVQAQMRGVRPQLSHAEVLNMLLRRWTAALVSRGAPPQLPEVTAELWEVALRANSGGRCRLTMGSAIMLLWLALADCEPLCRLSDLFRWARQGVVPIFSAANELPEDVTFNWMLLGLSKRLSASCMRSGLLTMVKKLKLVPPPQPPLRQLLRRLLAELVLPAQLADVVANVARRTPPPDTILPEADALALLLVTLKMLLGLDDATEIRNSEVAAARNEVRPDGPRWFVLTEWLEFVRQQRATAGEQDFLQLESDDRDLGTVGGPDLCRRRHRQLLFDFYRREGAFRGNVEAPYSGCSRFYKPEYKLQTRKLFGRPEAPGAPPPSDADDLLRPVGSQLEREGGEMLCRAEALRHSQVEFLLDESHVRSLQSEGVPVAVTRAAARCRIPTPHKTVRALWSPALRFLPRDIQLVGKRKQAIPAPEKPPPPRRRPRRDIRLFMPYREVWRMPAAWGWPRVKKTEYVEVASTWPASFHFLLEVLAASIELTPAEFALYVCRAEKNVLGVSPPAGAGGREKERRGRRKVVKKGDGKRESGARKKRGRVSSGESTTDVSSVEMELGSETETETETDKQADVTPYSPELFDE